MQLNKLSLYKNEEIVREVTFKSGLNLIINTASGNEKTGNGVGKSTPSRLLDYIFMSSGEDIYTEPEFGRNIPEVFEYITTNSIFIELAFRGHSGKDFLIGRTLTPNQKESVYYVDGEACEKSVYASLVSIQIFGQSKEKPTVRNLSHKFIRNTNDKMQKTTRFLHGNTKPDVYDQLYLFLFGFTGLDLLRDKAAINNKIKTKTKHLSAYRNPHRESALQKMLNPLKVEEQEIQRKIESFDFTGGEEADVRKLVNIQGELSDKTVAYSKIKSRIEYIEKSISRLKENASSVDGLELSDIYQQAGVSISGELKRSYEDLVVFHNQVILNKVTLLSKDVEDYKKEAASIKLKVDDLHSQESGIFKKMKEPDTLKSISQVYNEQTSIREQVTSVGTLLNKIEDTKKIIDSLEKSKGEIIKEISKNTHQLDENVEKFNEYFGDFSKSFYGDRYIFDLEFDSEKEKCQFEVANISPNPTGGKKKGELSAFDLAYIEFVEQVKLKRPTFIVHDSIEDVDVNQVYDIFQKANQLNGQYIIALLSDKISDPKFSKFKAESTILELSENDKFFKI
ncbi:MAG: hypothetical protein ACI9B7_000070 [Oleispira sp.]|jgi:uncharacterized protein YydD (DUF2326 family)